jgi:hypothetical protein
MTAGEIEHTMIIGKDSGDIVLRIKANGWVAIWKLQDLREEDAEHFNLNAKVQI